MTGSHRMLGVRGGAVKKRGAKRPIPGRLSCACRLQASWSFVLRCAAPGGTDGYGSASVRLRRYGWVRREDDLGFYSYSSVHIRTYPYISVLPTEDFFAVGLVGLVGLIKKPSPPGGTDGYGSASVRLRRYGWVRREDDLGFYSYSSVHIRTYPYISVHIRTFSSFSSFSSFFCKKIREIRKKSNFFAIFYNFSQKIACFFHINVVE